MDVIRLIAERKIEEAIQAGEFDDLPLSGRPLSFADNPWTHPEWRLGLKVLENAGILPPEMQLRKEMAVLRRQVRDCRSPERIEQLQRQLEEKRVRYRILMGY